MDAYEAILERRSIRSYKSDMVADEIIDKIVKAGTYAASALDRQPGLILVVKDKAMRDKLEEMNRKVLGNMDANPFYGAPVVLVVLADKSKPTYVYDGSLIMGNLMNAAFALGVDSCWINRAKQEFESEEGKEILRSLGIEGDYEGIGHCILGYRDVELPKPSKRKENFVYTI